ncbi:MAG: hypothetical protein CMA59_02450, partial [Euryarchaeota archaeon]|nr:hypothetical protein [Euryarchaeota archaeon]
MIKKYGNLLRAWACMGLHINDPIDRKKLFEISRGEAFCQDERKIKQMWHDALNEIAPEVAPLTLFKLAPNDVKTVQHLRKLMENESGSILKAWNEKFDKLDRGGINQTQFVNALREFGWGTTELSPGVPRKGEFYSAAKVFDLLDIGLSGVISLRDIDEESYVQLQAENRKEMLKRVGIWQKGQVSIRKVAETPYEFNQLMYGKFQTMHRAWYCLGFQMNEKVTFSTFEPVVRREGYGGDCWELWSEIDQRQLGYITLEDLAVHEVDALRKFKERLKKQFGSILKAWVDEIDLGKTFRVSKRDFALHCAGVRRHKDELEKLEQIFDVLDIEMRGSVSLNQLDETSYEEFLLKTETIERTEDNGLRLDLIEILKTPRSPRSVSPKKLPREEKIGEKEKRDKKVKEVAPDVPMDLPSMIAVLEQKYGTVIRAWLSFGPGKNGRMTYAEFSKVMLREGFGGDVRDLWNAAHAAHGGERLTRKGVKDETISIDEFCSRPGDMIRELKVTLIQRFGSLVRAWIKVLDPKQTGMVNKDDFVRTLEVQIPQFPAQDREPVFQYMDLTGSGFITLNELDPKAHAEYIRIGLAQGDKPTQKVGMGVAGKTTRAFRLTSVEASAQRTRMKKKWEKKIAQEMGASTAEQFLEVMCNKYGNLVRCWCVFGGGKGGENLTIDFPIFARAVRHEGYVGSITELWKTICKNPASGKMHLEEWDPTGAEDLANFRRFLQKRYGSVLRGWLDAIDLERSFVVSRDRFVATLITMGFQPDHAKRIFEFIDTDADGLASLHEMDPVAHRALMTNEAKYVSEYERSKEAPELQDAHYSKLAIRRHAEARVNRREREETEAQKRSTDQKAYTVEEFHHVLRRKYKNLVRAWQKMCGRHVESMGFNEFAVAARRMGFGGSVREVFSLFDEDRSRILEMQEFCPDDAELLEDFRSFVKRRYGSMQNAWDRAFNLDKTNQVTESQFCHILERVGFPRAQDAKLLFDILNYDATGVIGLYDLDPAAHEDLKQDFALSQIKEVQEKDTFVQKHATKLASTHRAVGVLRRKRNEDAVQAKKDREMISATPQELKQQLERRYGNVHRGWLVLSQGNEHITFGKFSQRVRFEGYRGDLQLLWKEVNPRGLEAARLEDFAPYEHQQIQHLKAFMRAKHGTVKGCWFAEFDRKKAFQVNRLAWKRTLENMGWISTVYERESPDTLFNYLDYMFAETLTLKHLDPAAYDQAMRREEDLDRYLTDEDKTKPGWRIKRRQALGHLQRQRIEDRWKAEASKDVKAGNLDEFREQVSRKYGSIVTAWFGMTNGQFTISQADFFKQVRIEGYRGNYTELWNVLDPDGDNFLRMDEFAPKDGKIALKFYNYMIEKYGSVRKAWNQVLARGRIFVNEAQFVAGVKESEFPLYEYASKIFKWLDASHGNSLTLNEISLQAEEDKCAGWDEYDMNALDPTSKTPSTYEQDSRELHSYKRMVVPIGKSESRSNARGRSLSPNNRKMRFVGLPPGAEELSRSRTQSPPGSPKTGVASEIAVKFVATSKSAAQEDDGRAVPLWARLKAKGKGPDERAFKVLARKIKEGKEGGTDSPNPNVSGSGRFTGAPALEEQPLPQPQSPVYRDESQSPSSPRSPGSPRSVQSPPVAPTHLQKFYDILEARHGNVVRGWYEITQHHSTATYEVFANGVRNNGWTGEPLQLWREMLGSANTDGIVISLTDFHPQAAATLKLLRGWMVDRYGTVPKAWVQMLKSVPKTAPEYRSDGDISSMKGASISMYRFIDVLDHLGFPGNSRMAYKMVDYEGHGYVTLNELDATTQDPVFR